MNDQTNADPLAAAIEAEKGSLGAYLGFAWRTHDAGGRAMFIRLACDEFEHMRLLERQQAEPAGTDTEHPWAVPVSAIEALIPRLGDTSRRIKGESGQNDVAALRTALELERTAVGVYSGLAQSAPDSARLLFQRLAEMEQSHVALIQAELDNIQGDGYWFGVPEFTLESERL